MDVLPCTVSLAFWTSFVRESCFLLGPFSMCSTCKASNASVHLFPAGAQWSSLRCENSKQKDLHHIKTQEHVGPNKSSQFQGGCWIIDFIDACQNCWYKKLIWKTGCQTHIQCFLSCMITCLFTCWSRSTADFEPWQRCLEHEAWSLRPTWRTERTSARCTRIFIGSSRIRCLRDKFNVFAG